MIEYIREMGLEVSAETYAYQSYFKDIEDLTAEELAEIPDYLLDEYNERLEREAEEGAR
jgi:hypothetical protein